MAWRSFGFGEWSRIVDEGLLILGWVAMWKPLELLLYDWWPGLRKKRTYDFLEGTAATELYTLQVDSSVRCVQGAGSRRLRSVWAIPIGW